MGAALSVAGLVLMVVMAAWRGTSSHVVACAVYGANFFTGRLHVLSITAYRRMGWIAVVATRPATEEGSAEMPCIMSIAW